MDFLFFFSCVNVWTLLFALMIRFSLPSAWSWNWTLPLSRVVIHLYLNFFILKLENGLKKQVRNVTETKYRFAKLIVYFFILFFCLFFYFLRIDLIFFVNKLKSLLMFFDTWIKAERLFRFLKGQSLIEGFHAPFRFRRNKNGGEILLYIWEFKRK